MKIDGKLIAGDIKENLKKQIDSLKKKNITPNLAVVLIGSDPSSLSYIKQKQKVGEELGVKVTIIRQPQTEKRALFKLLWKLNTDSAIHGIIIQRPVPIDIDKKELDRLVIPSKDVDGFHPDSPLTPPIANAVLKILEWTFSHSEASAEESHTISENLRDPSLSFRMTKRSVFNWLKTKKILIIGRGETGGKPIADTFKKMKIPFIVAHSKTNNLKDLCLSSNIIISAVGKPNVVRHDMLTKKTILVGVGLHQEDGKLKPDYNQEEISNKVAFYTPVPGGVGPVNVACLFENLLSAVNLPLRNINK